MHEPDTATTDSGTDRKVPAVEAVLPADRAVAGSGAEEAPKLLGSGSTRLVPDCPVVVDVADLDWTTTVKRVDRRSMRLRMRSIVEAMETLLDLDQLPLLFARRTGDRPDLAPEVLERELVEPIWFIGDLHGDWLALEAALALINRIDNGAQWRIVFLGDLFDDGGFGLETLLRVFELVVQYPNRICVLAGNHDEALSYDGTRFSSSTAPSDFSEYLNYHLVHEWIERAGKATVRFFATAPRALFFPDGLLVAHGGFPLADLHPLLRETRNWNNPACLADFVWTRAHPTARRKLPNRFGRGSQFGHEDFAAFCNLADELGRSITHMVRGHDHVEERYAFYPAYTETPILTTVALSRRLQREMAGPQTRNPTIARYGMGALPQVYRLLIPAEIVNNLYPEEAEANETATITAQEGEATP
jgi:hypothetical protein